jgi:hypothetical protein
MDPSTHWLGAAGLSADPPRARDASWSFASATTSSWRNSSTQPPHEHSRDPGPPDVAERVDLYLEQALSSIHGAGAHGGGGQRIARTCGCLPIYAGNRSSSTSSTRAERSVWIVDAAEANEAIACVYSVSTAPAPWTWHPHAPPRRRRKHRMVGTCRSPRGTLTSHPADRGRPEGQEGFFEGALEGGVSWGACQPPRKRRPPPCPTAFPCSSRLRLPFLPPGRKPLLTALLEGRTPRG